MNVSDAAMADMNSSVERSRAEELIACQLVAHNAKTLSNLPSTDSDNQMALDSAIANVLGQSSSNCTGQSQTRLLDVRCPSRGSDQMFADHLSLVKHVETRDGLVLDTSVRHSPDDRSKRKQDFNVTESQQFFDDLNIKQEIDFSDTSVNAEEDVNASKKSTSVREMVWVNHPRSGLILRPKKMDMKDHSVAKPIEGKTLDTQLRQAIINLKWYFQMKNPDWKKKKVQEEIAEALQVGITWLYIHVRLELTMK